MKRVIGILLVTSLMACSQSEKKNTSIDSTTAVAAVDTTSSAALVKDSVQGNILSQYLILKNALVKGDSTLAKNFSAKLATSLNDYKGCELTATFASKIANAPTLAVQRKEFTTVSADLISLFKHADLNKGTTLFVQHCPMANKGDGGDWISVTADIKNPYYGDEMLECGSVVEKFAAK
ncbi:DUF3347 domain-containing protein [Pedobacter sp. AW1-32]|uniref:DUF3347 domain-containing protein n=1 Tax=Pedobacter sp. AW1-32 TaxID=3383026 RepID=UPI003FEE8217